MQFKQVVSMAMLANLAAKGMAAPLPATTTTTEVDIAPGVQARSPDAAFNGKKKKIGKHDTSMRTSPDKPEGCLDWVIIGEGKWAMGYCRKWEDIWVEEPDVSARDFAEDGNHEESPLDIAMPYWAAAAL
jgi:hypothetical protein